MTGHQRERRRILACSRRHFQSEKQQIADIIERTTAMIQRHNAFFAQHEGDMAAMAANRDALARLRARMDRRPNA